MNNTKENSENYSNFSLISEKLCILLEGNLALYLKPSSNKKKVCDSIKILIIFMYIIIYNIEQSENIILFFRMNYFNLITIIKRGINIFKEDKENIYLAHFIINICFDDLKKKIYAYKDKNLEDIYHNYIYSEILKIFPSFNEPINHKNENFTNFMKNILEMEIDDYINNLKKENSSVFCKNLIPLLLSTPNFDFISFYTNIINKHIEIIRKEYNNELTSLFRKDDITNDLIKNLVFIFGNYSFIKSFYMILPKEYLSTDEINFDLDAFEKFLNNFIIKLIQSLPFIIKVLLCLIKNCIYKINPGEEYYNVVYTVLIFNFFISPAILELYGISIVKFRSLRQLTRILRNICFGKEFDSNDKLSYFNKKIKVFNLFINKHFNKYIFDEIDIEKDYIEINKRINTLLVNSKNIDMHKNNNSIMLPSFCFQVYWENISNIINFIKK